MSVPANQVIPQGQSTGQALGDLFGGVNRPQLNAFVAQSQARNGLVSAQTQDAMVKASQAQEQQQAWDDLKSALMQKGYKESDADLARAAMVGATNHDPETAMKVLAMGDLGSGDPATQTAGQQMYQGHIAGPITTPADSQLPVGSQLAQQPVNVSPTGQAAIADTNSQTALRNAQAQAGGFNPHTGAGAGGAPLDPNAVAFGSYMLYKTGKMPAMGMGGGPARMAIISGAAQLAQQEAAGQPIQNQGFDTAIANGQDFTGAQRMINSVAGGPLGNQARSINNDVGHLQLMENLFTGLQNGDVQIVNKLGNQWGKAFGSPIPTNIQTAASFIGPETIKILSNNGSSGTGEERQEFSNTAANLANAPEQTGQAIGTLKAMLGRQLTDMALQYHGATGRSDFVRRYVAPDVAQYLDVAPQAAGAESAVQPPATSPNASVSPAGGAATTLPPQALGVLKDGIHTTFGNGQVWTLQNGKPVRVQ
jgi:hypothetical protein